MRNQLVLLAGLAAACSGPKAEPRDPGAELDRITRSFFDQNRLVGLAVGVVNDDSVWLSRGYGTMTAGGNQPVTESTVFHLASVTKPFVATAVMQLVEEGKVNLDLPITQYVRYFQMKDPRAAGITVRQVLTHTAGLPDVTDYAWGNPEYDAGALERYIRGLRDSSLVFGPGEQWQYSNIGFELLANLVAVVSADDFEDFIQQRILTPLRMTKSTLLMTDVDSALLAMGHEADSAGGVFRPAPAYPYNRRHAGSSTLHSNVTDMLRWARANLSRGTLDGATILSPASYDSLWREQRDMTEALKARAKAAGIRLPFDSVAVGLSWILPTRKGERLVHHAGGDLGFRSDLLLVPGRQIGIVLMTNSGANNLQELTLELLDAVVAAEEAAP